MQLEGYELLLFYIYLSPKNRFGKRYRNRNIGNPRSMLLCTNVPFHCDQGQQVLEPRPILHDFRYKCCLVFKYNQEQARI